MISLSNLFKPTHYRKLEERKLIEVLHVDAPPVWTADEADDENESLARDAFDEEASAMREQLLRDAEETAERMLEQAREEAEAIRVAAREEIDAWWNERRSEDAARAEEASKQGHDEGYRAGVEAAELAVRNEYASMLEQARTILESAQEQKQAIIHEAEPFLLELACAIAEKVIAKQLTLEPDWTLDLIKSVLARRREQGTITLCVAPSQYAYLNDAKEDLRHAIDSQAELLIVADASVSDLGCVVRSQYGSLDARIDTQLAEIRAALLQIVNQKEEYANDD